MKILPCKTNSCRGQPAMATKTIFQSAGQMLDPTMKYLCARCGRIQTITSMEFARLPEMTKDQVNAASCDLTWPEAETKG